MNTQIKKESEIKIKVSLDGNNIPVDLKWYASDSEHEQYTECKAINLSLWDPIEQNALAINLWTKEMRVDEMHAHYFRTLLNITDAYAQATNNPFAKKQMEEYCKELAKKTSDWEQTK